MWNGWGTVASLVGQDHITCPDNAVTTGLACHPQSSTAGYIKGNHYIVTCLGSKLGLMTWWRQVKTPTTLKHLGSLSFYYPAQFHWVYYCFIAIWYISTQQSGKLLLAVIFLIIAHSKKTNHWLLLAVILILTPNARKIEQPHIDSYKNKMVPFPSYSSLHALTSMFCLLPAVI